MPTYRYACSECDARLELLQTVDEMESCRDRLRCQQCEAPMRFTFPTPHLQTNNEFVAGWGDGFGDKVSGARTQAHRAARRAGVNPHGKTYCPGLCAPGVPNDPAAWVPHDDAKGYVEKRCRELNYGCEGMVNVAQRKPESDPHDKPYRVAPDLVDREVERVLETEHGGKIDAQKRSELTKATAERLAGNS